MGETARLRPTRLAARASVRVRTTAAALAVVGAALAVGSLGLVTLLYRTQRHDLQGDAYLRASDVAALVRTGSLTNPIPRAPGAASFVQVVDAAGRVVAATANIAGEAAIATFRPEPERAVRTLRRVVAGDDDRYRVVALAAKSPDGPVTVYAALNLEALLSTVHAVGIVLLGGIPALLLVVGVTTWTVVGRALRPVEQIRREVAEFSASDLSRRVPEPTSQDEIARLAQTMNLMLDRLARATARQRQFVADASHELRSPITSLRVELEVAGAAPDQTDWPTVSREALVEVIRMEHLVDDLLVLARADADEFGARTDDVDFDDVVAAEVSRVRQRDKVRVSVTAFEAALVCGDRAQLARSVRNVIENAERYARSAVEVSLRVRWPEAELIVTDDGPGIPEAQREHVFERFARLDGDRARPAGGAGLGLAIAREIVMRHRGTIAVENASIGARVVLRLPVIGADGPTSRS